MSIERKDARTRLAADIHAQLCVLAEVDQIDIAEFIERAVNEAVLRRVHDATVIADRIARLGISGKTGERAGKSE